MTEGIGSGDVDDHERIYRRQLEPDERRMVSLALVEATEEVMDETTTRNSLYDAVNPDALDQLFRPHPDGTPRASGAVGFPLGDYEIRIDTDGTIEIYGPERTGDG